MDRPIKAEETKMSLLSPVSPSVNLNLCNSTQIITEFIDSNLPAASIDVNETGRKKRNVYIALHQYLKIHPDIPVSVKMQDGVIVLQKRQ